MFAADAFTVPAILFTAIGAAVLWAKLGRSEQRAFVLRDLVEVLPLERRGKRVLEFLIFITLGSVVGVGVVEPSTVPQALSAGFGWTGLFSGPERQS